MKLEVAACPEVIVEVAVTPEGRMAQTKINAPKGECGLTESVPSVHQFLSRKRF